MTPEAGLEALSGYIQPGRGPEMAAYHKVKRPYLGIANPDIDALTRTWRQELTLDDRLALADGLWATNIHEARLAAAKLLTQARIRPEDDSAWTLIQKWVPDFDAWAVADHVSIAGQKRLVAEPSRLDALEAWTTSEHLWTKRAALVMTLPWARQKNPKAADTALRDRILGWAASYTTDHQWFIQKAIGWWLRDHSKHDPEAVLAFIEAHGDAMKPFARKEALRLLKP